MADNVTDARTQMNAYVEELYELQGNLKVARTQIGVTKGKLARLVKAHPDVATQVASDLDAVLPPKKTKDAPEITHD